MARGAYMTEKRVEKVKELLAAYPEKSYVAIGKMLEPKCSGATVARVKHGEYDPKPVEAEPEPKAEPDSMEMLKGDIHDISNRVSQVTDLQHSQATKLNAMHDELAALLETAVDLLAMSVQVNGINAQMQVDSMRDGFVPKADYITKRRERLSSLVKEAISYAG